MNDKQLKRASKLLSLVLRHDPSRIGIELDSAGWTNIQSLIEGAATAGFHFDVALLEHLVKTSDKQRFSISEDGTRIRANQGHSIAVDLQLKAIQPPELLYHGTVERFLPSIREIGLQKQNRHHVHLSGDVETAKQVGGRRGKPQILIVRAKALSETGVEFYLSDNKVWLVDAVPPEFIEFP